MSNAPTKSASAAPSSTPVKAPAQTNPVRMGILLALLVVVLLMLAHHFLMAAPATEQAYKDIQKLFDDRNARGVVSEDTGGKIDAKLVQPKDVQELLKKKPWSTNTQKDYTVETYWWYGMPHQNYVTVLYYGSGDNLKFNTHYWNSKPPAEDLPGAMANEGPPLKGDAPPPTTATEGTKSGEGTPPGPGAPPAAEKPAEGGTEKPADKPAEDAEKKE
jgi:hypothetical protein